MSGNMFRDDDEDLKKIDRVSEEHGFKSREKQRKRNAVGATVQLNVKLDTETHEKFLKYAEQFPGAGYRVVIQKLLEQAGF